MTYGCPGTITINWSFSVGLCLAPVHPTFLVEIRLVEAATHAHLPPRSSFGCLNLPRRTHINPATLIRTARITPTLQINMTRRKKRPMNHLHLPLIIPTRLRSNLPQILRRLQFGDDVVGAVAGRPYVFGD